MNKYHGGTFDQDEAAQKVYAFAMDARNMQYGKLDQRCNHCASYLQYDYCEDRLYMIRCLHCATVALVEAKNPQEAACKTLGG